MNITKVLEFKHSNGAIKTFKEYSLKYKIQHIKVISVVILVDLVFLGISYTFGHPDVRANFFDFVFYMQNFAFMLIIFFYLFFGSEREVHHSYQLNDQSILMYSRGKLRETINSKDIIEFKTRKKEEFLEVIWWYTPRGRKQIMTFGLLEPSLANAISNRLTLMGVPKKA